MSAPTTLPSPGLLRARCNANIDKFPDAHKHDILNINPKSASEIILANTKPPRHPIYKLPWVRGNILPGKSQVWITATSIVIQIR